MYSHYALLVLAFITWYAAGTRCIPGMLWNGHVDPAGCVSSAGYPPHPRCILLTPWDPTSFRPAWEGVGLMPKTMPLIRYTCFAVLHYATITTYCPGQWQLHLTELTSLSLICAISAVMYCCNAIWYMPTSPCPFMSAVSYLHGAHSVNYTFDLISYLFQPSF